MERRPRTSVSRAEAGGTRAHGQVIDCTSSKPPNKQPFISGGTSGGTALGLDHGNWRVAIENECPSPEFTFGVIMSAASGYRLWMQERLDFDSTYTEIWVWGHYIGYFGISAYPPNGVEGQNLGGKEDLVLIGPGQDGDDGEVVAM